MGKDINDLGKFDDCNQNTDMHYFLLSIRMASGPGSISIGICLPNSCS